ncbi:MAG: hypothetical protein K2W95_10600 [Candidatus Obscuribacterales bacterium]|nr:hypothetical protein [Candidatus Obscuribacterales bacterium]
MSDLLNELHPSVAAALLEYKFDYKVMQCDPNMADTAAFCEHYKIPPARTCNAILGAGKAEPTKFACCVILATCKLDVNKKVCQLLGVKRCSFASAEQTLEVTSMQLGGVTPVGIPPLPIYIDSAVMSNEEVVLGGGNRSTKLLLPPCELLKLPGAQIVEGLGILRQ